MKLSRYIGNPILKPNEGNQWESKAVFNPAAVYTGGKIHVFYRAVGEYERYISRLGHAILDEDLNLVKRSHEPGFVPEGKGWEKSVEDPRFTLLEGNLYMTYVVTATPGPPGAVRRRLGIPDHGGTYPRTALAEVKDFCNFERLGIITPEDTDERDVVLFPEKIKGRYAVYHRAANWVGPNYGTEFPGIWFAYLDGLNGDMFEHKLVMKSERDWESKKIGAGPPPVKTKEGWLLIYHGVDKNHVYRTGVALLDLEEPWRVIARSPGPIFVPEEEYEMVGDVPNVVFPEGIVNIGDELLIFYGAADKVCCAARVCSDELIDYLLAL
ncbi:glycosidase [candidate division KSB1 bacterium]|nr:glycosidase [candidate division KSB1 bacterium]